MNRDLPKISKKHNTFNKEEIYIFQGFLRAIYQHQKLSHCKFSE